MTDQELLELSHFAVGATLEERLSSLKGKGSMERIRNARSKRWTLKLMDEKDAVQAKLERAVGVLRYLHAHAELKQQARKSIQAVLVELEDGK